MKNPSSLKILAAAFAFAAPFVSPSAFAAADTWSSTGTTANWNLAGNWSGGLPISTSNLTFDTASGSGTTLNNDLTSLSVAGITFNAGAPAYTLGGNAITLTSPILNSSTNLQTINLNITVTAARIVTLGTGGGNVTLGGTITGTSGGITANGTGTLTLSGTNSYDGDTRVNNAAATIVAAGTNSSAGTTTVTIGTFQLGNASNGGIASGTVTMGGGTLQSLLPNQSLSNAVSVTSGSTVISGANNITLNGVTTFASSATRVLSNNISGGNTLTFQGNIFLGSNSTGGFSPALGGSGITKVNGIIGDYSGGTATGGNTLKISNTGTGTTTLNNANTYTGGTNINTGTLIAANHTALGTGAVTVANSAGLAYIAPSDTTLALGSTLAFSGAATLGGTIGSTTTSAEIITTGNATSTTAALTVNVYGLPTVTPSTGTYTLLHGGGGANTLNNFSSITLGKVFNNTNWKVGSLAKSANDITVGITSASALAAAYWTGTATAGITKVWAASNGNATSNWSSTSGGVVQGLVPGSAADVAIVGTTVNATNSTLGANMTVNSLTIQDTANGLGLNADGNTLTINAAAGNYSAGTGIVVDTSVPASTIAANVALGADQTWTTNSALAVSGNVSGAHALTKAGSGVLSLSGANTYTGATTVFTGTLLVNGSTSSSSAVSVSSGATLGGTGTLGGATTVNGILAPGNGGIGTLNIAANVTWAGAASAGSTTDWVFDLGASTTADKLAITGNFNKDTTLGTKFRFDFGGSTQLGIFTLATWTGTTGFSLGDFSYTNLGGGDTGSFNISGSSLQFIAAVPEPATWGLLAFGLTTVLVLRRRRG